MLETDAEEESASEKEEETRNESSPPPLRQGDFTLVDYRRSPVPRRFLDFFSTDLLCLSAGLDRLFWGCLAG